jgi:ABC-type thiamin/hydroxymethylpyrimidine transport system permease subunit
MKGNTLAVALVVLAVVFLLLAGLYYEGALQIFVSDPHATHHTTHAILFGVLAIASLIGANFARTKRAS